MTRYRYGNPKSQSFLQKSRPFILMFVGWNLLAVMTWKFLNSNMAKKDPAWETRSESERIAALGGSAPKDTVKHKYSLLGKTESDS